VTALGELPEAPTRVAARIAALKAAMELRSAVTKPDQVIELARQFEVYLLEGQTGDEKSGKAATPPTARA